MRWSVLAGVDSKIETRSSFPSNSDATRSGGSPDWRVPSRLPPYVVPWSPGELAFLAYLGSAPDEGGA